MKTLAIIFVLTLAVTVNAAQVWPDSIPDRDTSLYYIARTDTTWLRPVLVGDTTKLSFVVDTVMGRKALLDVCFKGLPVSKKESDIIQGIIWGILHGDADKFRSGIKLTVDSAFVRQQRKGKK